MLPITVLVTAVNRAVCLLDGALGVQFAGEARPSNDVDRTVAVLQFISQRVDRKLTGAQHDTVAFDQPVLAADRNVQALIVNLPVADIGGRLYVGAQQYQAMYPSGCLAGAGAHFPVDRCSNTTSWDGA